MSDTNSSSWAALLREAAQSIDTNPLKRVEALRAQFRLLEADLPRGALKVQEKSTDQLERQLRRSSLKDLATEACSVFAEFGVRMTVESVAQRRPRKKVTALGLSASPAAPKAEPASVLETSRRDGGLSSDLGQVGGA